MFRLLEKISPLTAKQADELARAAKRFLQRKLKADNLADKETSEAQRELAKERARRAAR